MNFAKFLRTPFLQNTSRRLLLNVVAKYSTPKSNGKVRLCVDAQKINKAIKRETSPIPTLESVLDGMSDSKIVSKIDLKEAYQELQS